MNIFTEDNHFSYKNCYQYGGENSFFNERFIYRRKWFSDFIRLLFQKTSSTLNHLGLCFLIVEGN